MHRELRCIATGAHTDVVKVNLQVASTREDEEDLWIVD